MKQIDNDASAEYFNDLVAKKFMETDVKSYSRKGIVKEMAWAMTKGEFGSVPITNPDKTLIGIISEFDLLDAILAGKNLEKLTAEEIMTKDPIAIKPDTSSKEIIRLLQEKKLIRLLVVDEDEKLVGVVSRKDILKGFLVCGTPYKPPIE